MSESRKHYVRPLDLKAGRIDMAHGSGGRAMAQLIDEVFARQLELRMVPRLLRRLVLRWNLRSASAKRALRIGTFSLSTLAGEGCSNRDHPTFLTTSLSYDPLDDAGLERRDVVVHHVEILGELAMLADGPRAPA